jgi:glutathione S-transferase
LAICEYFAEISDQNLWPKNARDRALARSYAAEMHSGFAGLRTQLSMDLRQKIEIRHLTTQTISDIDRILYLWTEALKKSKGPFLFGEFGIVDAFYAPVVFRFLSYGIRIKSKPALKYMADIQNYKHVKSWYNAGLKENPKPYIFK